MRRVTGVVFLGLGLLCVVLAAVLAWVFVPMQKKVPTDMKPPDVVVNAPNATFVAAKVGATGLPQVAVEHGALRSATAVEPDADTADGLTGDLSGDTLIWNVSQSTVGVDSGTPISGSKSRIALDRVSGAAVPWSGQCYQELTADPASGAACTPGNIAFAGQLYLFPFGTGKKTYQYWDGTLRAATPIAYRAEETVAGLTTYRFEQVVPRQKLPLDARTAAGLIAFLAPGAHTATMSYQATRTLWVEPMTGAIVAYREQQHRELVPDTGAAVVLLDATFEYDAATAKAIADEAKDGRSQLLLFGRYLPIGLVVLGVLAIVAGLLMVRRAPARRMPVAADAREAQPTDVPQG